MNIDELHDEIADAKYHGEDPDVDLTDLPVDTLIRMLGHAERVASEWRLVKAILSDVIASDLAGRKVRYGQTLYRSRRKTTRRIPSEMRGEFAEWVVDGGPERVGQLFNPNTVRYGQLRDMEAVDRDTGEIQSAFYRFVNEDRAEDAPWVLEALPASRWPAYAEQMPEGEVQ